ncbi:chromosome partitioning protein ParB [Clostridium botulinum]|uniref:ParB/RepB/Spo0J family partition protein n=1 Tax=Clostridium botulinum TaxID=1491 RepID=UPI001968959A|nr:ParB N-terminal domain-containing protein [Clostridium botulinum]MBN1042327.1 chromosome partitioning protein ParB [Clostridium botulinum]
MALTGKFNLNDIMKSKSNKEIEVNTKEYKSIRLSPYDVVPSQSNFYSQENIEELADTFLIAGQQQPTVLGRVNGEFKILSGHRRNLANIFNIERGYKKYEEVEYLYKDMTESFFELSLIIGNAFTRKLTPYEETEQVVRLKKALVRARDEDGLEISGKLRNVISDLLDTSSTQVARMEAINNNLTEEAKEEFKKGNLGMTSAYETSRLPEEEQRKIADKASKGEEVKPKDIATMMTEKKKENNFKKVSETDTKTNEKEVAVDVTTGEIVEQKVPSYLNRKMINFIKELNTEEFAKFLCDRCTGLGGGNGCAGLCDLALECKGTNKHEVCKRWLNQQI